MGIVDHVAALRHAVAVAEPIRGRVRNRVANLIGGPDVKRTLAFDRRIRRIDDAVRVFGRIEAAFGVGHVAQDVIQDAAGDRGVLRSPVIWNASR